MPMVEGGGGSKPRKKKAPKPIGPPTLSDIPKKEQIGGKDNPSKVNKKGVVVPKASSSKGYKKGFTNEKSYTKSGTIKQSAAKKLGLSYKGSNKGGGKGEVKQTLDYTPPATKTIKKKRFGGAAGGGITREGGRGGGGFDINRTGRLGGSNNLGMPNKVGGSFRDRDLVGSGNQIDNYDGTNEFVGGGNEFTSGGGGGTASALAGREAVGRVGKVEGQSMEEIVYGVKKRGRKVRRPKGE